MSGRNRLTGIGEKKHSSYYFWLIDLKRLKLFVNQLKKLTLYLGFDFFAFKPNKMSKKAGSSERLITRILIS